MQESSFSEEEYVRVREKAEIAYKKISEVYCPYFKEKVHLNAKGWEHLLYKSRDNKRSKEDQLMRLKLLKHVPLILISSYSVQGVGERVEWHKKKKHGRWESSPIRIKYYEFIAVIGNSRIKIILKEEDSGPKYFWSIIPFWKINKITGKRILHGGNLED